MAFGIYIHIPYCIQRCSYCDFATYVHTEILPPSKYIDLVLQEAESRKFFSPQTLSTLYFGGGTPSLIPAEYIVALIQGLEKFGYRRGLDAETTIEINPATIDEKKLEIYLENGINRFSVGAQTFDDRLLRLVGREHNAEQTLQTLDLLKKYNVNFTFDVLFALPTQTMSGLRRDIEIAIERGAKHISPYCLTVPSGHPLSAGRPPEEEQVEMFDFIYDQLTTSGFRQYEISNFAKPGFESKHNLIYWTDENYWGLGLSAHSYNKNNGAWGRRFWNPNTIQLYEQQILAAAKNLPSEQFEDLEEHQSLTDFCHTSLRLQDGLLQRALQKKFSSKTLSCVWPRLESLCSRGLLEALSIDAPDKRRWSLSRQGLVLSNLVFQELTFLKEELPV